MDRPNVREYDVAVNESTTFAVEISATRRARRKRAMILLFEVYFSSFKLWERRYGTVWASRATEQYVRLQNLLCQRVVRLDMSSYKSS